MSILRYWNVGWKINRETQETPRGKNDG